MHSLFLDSSLTARLLPIFKLLCCMTHSITSSPEPLNSPSPKDDPQSGSPEVSGTVQCSGSYTDIARTLVQKTAHREYKLGTWDCSIFSEAVVEEKLGRSLSDDERKRVKIDYDLQGQYGGTPKEAYDRALAAKDLRINGAPGFMVDQGLADYCLVSDLTDQDITRGAACQISWKNGGGHAGFISGVIRNQDGSIKALKIITAHSLENPETGRTGAYEATISMAKIEHVTIAVAK